MVLAHKMAMENPLVQAEAVDAAEFPELVARHNVSGVPQTTINDGASHVVGAVPEPNLMVAMLKALR